jgi:hypothetical protein
VAALRTQVWNGSLIIRGPSVVLAILGRNAISPRRGLLIYQAVNSPMPHSARNATSPSGPQRLGVEIPRRTRITSM